FNTIGAKRTVTPSGKGQIRKSGLPLDPAAACCSPGKIIIHSALPRRLNGAEIKHFQGLDRAAPGDSPPQSLSPP
ncbi:hypothetical protein, partial [Azospirillum sp. TSO22-1]|uniref:hypothetical protein n=1 Tax=Azospirillum sp. TSO22-1 TaxID=716789 RepID=UPI001B3B7AFE